MQSPSEQQLPVPIIAVLLPLPAAGAPAVAAPALPAALCAMPAAPAPAAAGVLAVMPALPLLAAGTVVFGVCTAVRPALPVVGALRPAIAPEPGALLAGAALAPALDVLDVGSAELEGGVSAPHAAVAEARNITKRDVRYLFMPLG
jgi:hypothetical protein